MTSLCFSEPPDVRTVAVPPAGILLCERADSETPCASTDTGVVCEHPPSRDAPPTVDEGSMPSGPTVSRRASAPRRKASSTALVVHIASTRKTPLPNGARGTRGRVAHSMTGTFSRKTATPTPDQAQRGRTRAAPSPVPRLASRSSVLRPHRASAPAVLAHQVSAGNASRTEHGIHALRRTPEAQRCA